MSTVISIKNFRKDLASYADAAERGKSFIVLRRSKPSFKIVPVSGNVEIEDEDIVETDILGFSNDDEIGIIFKKPFDPKVIINKIKILKDKIAFSKIYTNSFQNWPIR